MSNNKPTRKYFLLEKIVSRLLIGVSGWKAWALSFLLNWVFRWLAKEGVFLIDVGTATIVTNLDEKNWKKVVSDSWEKVAKGDLTEEEGKAIDDKFIKAFDRFVVFRRVRNK